MHMCSLYAYITSLQHNIISNFFVMKYNLPTNWLFLLSLETQWNYVCYHSFLQWFINKFMYNTLGFFSFLSAYTLSQRDSSRLKILTWRLFRVSDQRLIKWFGFFCPNFEFALRSNRAMLSALPASVVYLQHLINSLLSQNLHFLPFK